MTADGLFQIEGVEKRFPNDTSLFTRLRPDKEETWIHAVDGVDLTVHEGETLGLVGESGCGKSTLARTALRLIEPTAGKIYYRDEEVTAYDSSQLQKFRKKAQMIFQDPFASLNPRYTVRKTLTEPMEVHNIGGSRQKRDERAAKLMDQVGLTPDHLDRNPHEFSGGQRQRVSMARALAVEPQLIIADEPVSALDVSVQAQILNLLEELCDEMGLSMLFISHDLSVVRRICDRVAVMYLGEIVEVAETDKLFRNPNHPYTQALLSSIPTPDPTVERERIPLTGDVPTPTDPPDGCRFHPRCPKVIPPTEWTGRQETWRRVIELKGALQSDQIHPDSIREQLEAQGGPTDQEEVAAAIYEEYLTKRKVPDRETVSLPEDAETVVRKAIDRLLNDGNQAATAILDAEYQSVCETDVPRELEIEANCLVRCHRHDPEKPGESESPSLIRKINDGDRNKNQ